MIGGRGLTLFLQRVQNLLSPGLQTPGVGHDPDRPHTPARPQSHLDAKLQLPARDLPAGRADGQGTFGCSVECVTGTAAKVGPAAVHALAHKGVDGVHATAVRGFLAFPVQLAGHDAKGQGDVHYPCTEVLIIGHWVSSARGARTISSCACDGSGRGRHWL